MIRVLYVEDEEDLRELVQFKLKKKDMTVSCVPTGEAALEIIQPDERMFDVFLIDLMLGGRIGGVNLRDRINLKPNYRETPCIAITAAQLRYGEDYCKARGFKGYIPKPIDFNRLEKTIRQLQNDSAGI